MNLKFLRRTRIDFVRIICSHKFSVLLLGLTTDRVKANFDVLNTIYCL